MKNIRYRYRYYGRSLINTNNTPYLLPTTRPQCVLTVKRKERYRGVQVVRKQCLALLQQSSIDCHCLVVSCREQSRRTSHCIRWLTNRPDAALTLTTVAAAAAAATVHVAAATVNVVAAVAAVVALYRRSLVTMLLLLWLWLILWLWLRQLMWLIT